MIDIKLFFTWLGILLTIGAFTHYFWSIYKGSTKPHSYTWFTFSLLLLISFFIQRENGGWLGTWVLFVDFVCCFLAFLAALKYGEKHITYSDKLFLSWAMIALIAWLIFEQPYISAILIIVIDIFAILPTYRKSWSKPDEETIIIYLVSGLIFVSSLIAIESYSFLTTSHQITIILLDWGLVAFLLWRRRILNKNKW